MARKNTNAEVFEQLSEIGFIRDKSAAVSTTLGSGAAKDATSITVASAGSLMENDLIRIGQDNALEIGVIKTIESTTVTLRSPLVRAHASGEPVVTVEKVKIGDLTEDGATLENSTEANEIRAGTQKLVYARLIRSATQRITFSLLNLSAENLLASLGIPESNLKGTGTAADPFMVHLDPDLMNSQRNQSVYLEGVRHDGALIEVHGWGVEMEVNQSLQFQSGSGVPLPFGATVGALVIYIVEPS